MNKKIFIITVSVMALVIMALVAALAVVLAVPNVQKGGNTPDFRSEIQNSEHVLLSVSPVATTSSNGISKSILATVLPATASNKKVDWSVAWGDKEQTGNVTEFVSVVPSSDGSTSATITCRKAFTGTIIVTVTTRESGFAAHCFVTYVGMPTDIVLSGNIVPTGDVYKLGIGRTYDYNVSLTNPLNSIGENFNNIEISVSGYGAIKVGTYECRKTDPTNGYWLEGVDNSFRTLNIADIANNFLTASYSNGKLSITTIKTIESYYKTKNTLDSGRTLQTVDKYKESVGDCGLIVVIKEINSGLTKQMKIKFDESVVTGVNVSMPEIQF